MGGKGYKLGCVPIGLGKMHICHLFAEGNTISSGGGDVPQENVISFIVV
jgi:hypothetical protein